MSHPRRGLPIFVASVAVCILSIHAEADERKSNTFSKAAEAFLTALLKLDRATAKKLVTPESIPVLDELPASAEPVAGTPKAVEEKIDGDRAVVTMQMPESVKWPMSQFDMARIGGEWRVDFLTTANKMKIDFARSWVGNYGKMLESYRTTTGSFPTTEQGLKALVERPSIPPIPSSWSQVIPQLPPDPWGNPFRYELPAKRNKGGDFDVYSTGPDKQPFTSDDIGNWK